MDLCRRVCSLLRVTLAAKDYIITRADFSGPRGAAKAFTAKLTVLIEQHLYWVILKQRHPAKKVLGFDRQMHMDAIGVFQG